MLKSTIMPTKQSLPVSLDWKPHSYQKKAIKFLLQNSCAGLFLDPGLGKTGISLAALKILQKEKLIECGLVIAPLRVCYSVWPKEILKWKDFNGLRVSILHGKDKEKNLEKDADVYLINPEGLPWLLSHRLFKQRFKGQGLFIDESSKFKATNSKRFKLLRPVLPSFGRRYILTGSPAPNGLLDLFGQIYILDLGSSLGRYITHFRSKYFYPTGFGGYEWKLQQGADKLIQKQIRPLTLRLDADDYLELPELIVNDIYVDLPDEAWLQYKEMEDELIVAIERGDIVAVSAAVASGKCSQIANGGIYDAEGRAHLIHNAKTEVVHDLVGELNGTPALMAYEYGHDLERLRAVFGKDVPYIGGGVTPSRSSAIEGQWNRGELPLLLGQPQSIAHGLNLQNAGNHVIWHSLTWNWENYDQFIRRIRRQGSKHNKVFVHRVIARNTVDELKIMALNRKFRTQKDLFDALNTFLKRKSFTSAKSGSILEAGNHANLKQEELKMGKFSKTATATKEPAEKATKVKMWTNNPDWQDQTTGETTAAGKAQQAKAKAKNADKASSEKSTKAPAKKEPKEAAEDTRKITLITKENPKREGSAAFERFALYSKHKTVQSFIEAGGSSADLRYDEKAGHIKVA